MRFSLILLFPLLAFPLKLQYNYQPARNNLQILTPSEAPKVLAFLDAVENFRCQNGTCKVKLKPILSSLEVGGVNPLLVPQLKRFLGLRLYRRYSEDFLLGADERVVFFLKAKGYLEAAARSGLFIDRNGFAELSVKANGGKRFFWGGFELKGGCLNETEFYRLYDEPFGKPFSYKDLYKALNSVFEYCRKRQKLAFVYYSEPFGVKRERFLDLLFKNLRYSPRRFLDALSLYVNEFVENPFGSLKALFGKVYSVYPVLKVKVFRTIKVSFSGLSPREEKRLKKELFGGGFNFSASPSEIREKVLRFLKQNGYLDARVEVKISGNTLEVKVLKGKKYTLKVVGKNPPKGLKVGFSTSPSELKREIFKTFFQKGLVPQKVEVFRKKVPEKGLLLFEISIEGVKPLRCTVYRKLLLKDEGLKLLVENLLKRYSCRDFLLRKITPEGLEGKIRKLLEDNFCPDGKVKISAKVRGSEVKLAEEVVCKHLAKETKVVYWVEGRLPQREIEYILDTGGVENPALRAELLKRRLLLSGIFENPLIRKISVGNRTLLLAELHERKTFGIGGALGYTSDEGYLLELTLRVYNPLNFGESWFLSTHLTDKRRNYLVGFDDPFFFSSRLSFSAALFDKDEEHRDFDLLSKGFNLDWGYRLTAFDTFHLKTLFSNIGLSGDFKGGGFFKKLTISLERDGLLYTGILKLGEYSAGLSVSRGNFEESFFKYLLRGRFYLHYPEEQYLSVKFKAGYADEKTPVFERFYLGGLKDLKGFAYEEVAPLGGGRYMWYAGIEYGFPLSKKGLYLFSGFDLGNSVNRREDVLSKNKADIFTGLGFFTAYGPLRGGIAFPYDGGMNLYHFKLFLSLGFRF